MTESIYRAKPVTQRDGSPLAASNCRMASICTGLDFDTLGKKTSTGAKMRSYTDDQSGGTDSGDAKQSWLRGYAENLRVMDGHTWADAVADLNAGRLVHLDVWAAAVGSTGMCLSGSGAYGHTIAVAPEKNATRWLTADPWCSPPKWQWCEAAKLQKGAETWAGQVRAEQTKGPPGPIAEIIRRLMTRWTPEHPREDPPDPPETAGGSIYYTTTAAHPAGEGSDMARFVNVNSGDVESGKRLNVGAGSRWKYLDGSDGGAFSADTAVVWLGLLDSEPNQHVVRIKTGVPYNDKVARETEVLVTNSNKPYDAPPEPPPVSSYDEGWNDANAAAKAQIDLIIPPR
jgi:hypothetical protein